MSDTAQAALLVMMLVLPAAALMARRPPLAATLKMIAAWVVIFGVATIAVRQVERLRDAPKEGASALGDVRIERDTDGHYWAEARISGVARRMLIDSGATTTALSLGTAKAAGVNTEESTFPRAIDTANGPVVARTAHVERLTIGSIEVRDLPVVVSEAFGDQDLIGMNFLSRLGSWRVEGATMVLVPNSGA